MDRLRWLVLVLSLAGAIVATFALAASPHAPACERADAKPTACPQAPSERVPT